MGYTELSWMWRIKKATMDRKKTYHRLRVVWSSRRIELRGQDWYGAIQAETDPVGEWIGCAILKLGESGSQYRLEGVLTIDCV